MIKEYEQFFRNGGYRLMRLLVIKSEMESDPDDDALDVVGLMRLQYGGYTEREFWRIRAADEICRFYDIYGLNNALHGLCYSLHYNRGEVIEQYFGKGLKKRENGKPISKKTTEGALGDLLQRIEEYGNKKDPWFFWGEYDYASDGLAVVRKIMSYLQEASFIGDDVSASLLMRAVSSMKLFRNSRRGIMYGEALREFSERTGRSAESYYGYEGRQRLISDMFIREEVGTGQIPSRLESKVREGSSSFLIDWMYEIYSIMLSIEKYMPDKYEKIMSFHWTRNEEKLTGLFLEIAAMIAAVMDIEHQELSH